MEEYAKKEKIRKKGREEKQPFSMIDTGTKRTAII